MSSSRTPLKDFLLKNKQTIEKIDKPLSLLLGIGISTQAITNKLAEKFSKDKRRMVEGIDLIATDGSEKQGLIEQIVTYNIYKQLENRSLGANASITSQLFANEKWGYYSFEWMNFRARTLIGQMKSYDIDSEAMINARAELSMINERLPKLFWYIGYIASAINFFEEMTLLAKKDTAEQLENALHEMQAKALQNILCAQQLRNWEYSEKVLDLILENKNIKVLLTPGPSADIIPDDRDAALLTLEAIIKQNLAAINYDISIITTRVKFEMAAIKDPIKIETVLSESKQTIFNPEPSKTPKVKTDETKSTTMDFPKSK